MAAVLEEYQRPVAGGEIDTIRALLHDLRQPLAAILLLSGADAGDAARKLQGISGQARWLADLVETVLSEAAGDEVRCTDLTGLLDAAVARAADTADCVITVESEVAAEVWARPVALTRAVACVLDNAVRAAGHGGRVGVSIHRSEDGVHVTVSDNGPGLGKVAGRTSLGLTTIRAMVAACHGSFELHGGEGGGAVADICLSEARLRSVAS
ncbi:MAG TPA: ATP-binding protein [Pedococcus sp.]|jgi:signal transduction histidine kinase|nr:ATP-binding protein [Pedococcus sp.]